MHVVAVEFTVAAENHERFLERVVRQARDSRAEPGCLVFDVAVDLDRPGSVFLYELYRTPADFDAHKATAHFLSFDADIAVWAPEKRVRALTLVDGGV